MKIAMTVRISVVDGEIGNACGESIPLVIKVPDREFLDRFSGNELRIVGNNLGLSMAMVDMLGDEARAAVALDLGDPDTRDMMASWRHHGVSIELRHGDEMLTIRNIECATELDDVLALAAYPQPAAFLAMASYPRFHALLGANQMPGQELPAPNFLFSAALSESHWHASDKLAAASRK